jgi:hypothetical protein
VGARERTSSLAANDAIDGWLCCNDVTERADEMKDGELGRLRGDNTGALCIRDASGSREAFATRAGLSSSSRSNSLTRPGSARVHASNACRKPSIRAVAIAIRASRGSSSPGVPVTARSSPVTSSLPIVSSTAA